MGWNAPGRSSFLGNFACAARMGGGVDGLVYTNTAPLMRSPLSVSIPPTRAYMCKADTPARPLGERHGSKGAEWRVFMGGGTVVGQPRRFGCSGSLEVSD